MHVESAHAGGRFDDILAVECRVKAIRVPTVVFV